MDAMEHIEAREKLHMMQAVHLGQLNATDGKDTAVQSHTRALIRLAQPKDYSHLEDEED